jgi:acetolactate synthase-1/2/3 large subunit
MRIQYFKRTRVFAQLNKFNKGVNAVLSKKLAVDKICDIIEESGIEYVFGIQGGITYRIFNTLGRRKKVKLIIARHEQSASMMAAAYGRITGKPAILMGQGPFIASSGAFGILEGYLCGYPMLVIADAVTNNFGQKGMIQSGSGEYGSYDLHGILKTMTKYTALATTPKQAIQGIQLAIKHASTGRMGPAGLVIHQPDVFEEYKENEPPYIYDLQKYMVDSHNMPTAQQLQTVVELIKSANNPVIIAGNGVHMSRAYDELEQFSNMLGAPVATTYKGKSAIAETHPLALGMMGDYGQLVANKMISEADLLIVLGSKLGPSDTSQENLGLVNPQTQKLIQMDIDPHRAGWTYPIDASLIGDLKLTLASLIASISEDLDEERSTRRKKEVMKAKAELPYHHCQEMQHESSPVYPQRIIGILNEVLPDNAFLLMDAGSNRSWTAHLYKCKLAGSILVPGGIAGMGSSVPAAVAIKLVHPDRPVVCVIGDGGMAMTNNAISTAMQYDLPIIVVVMNDSRLGMPAARQGDDRISTDFIDTDFAKIAQGYGAYGVRIDSKKLKDEMVKALKGKVTTVIDVRLDTSQKYTSIQPFPASMQVYKKKESNPYTENSFF